MLHMQMFPDSSGVRRFTTDEVLRMVEVGILHDQEKVELLDGYLVEVSPEGPLHASTSAMLVRWLTLAYGEGYHVREAHPLMAGEHSMPEPDNLVVRGAPKDFRDRHPSGVDCVLAIEVSFSSQSRDARKSRIYAASGVPQYWRVDLDERHVIVESHPVHGVYSRREIVRFDESLFAPGVEESIILGEFVDG